VSIDRRRLQQSNDILARADGDLPPYAVNGHPVRPDGVHPRYQWIYSEELLTAMPIFKADGNYELDYICGCGTNKVIHTPDCNSLTVACVRFIQMKTDPLLPRGFALCQWTPPPSEDYWASNYGSFRYYPSNGLYRPLSHQVPGEARAHYIYVPYPATPFPELSERFISMAKDHYAKSAERLLAMEKWSNEADQVKTKDFTPGPGTPWARIRDAVADRTNLNGATPGSKGSVLRFNEPAVPKVPPGEQLVQLA
jgi:hypothetical protein